jgi:hypothetical protein
LDLLAAEGAEGKAVGDPALVALLDEKGDSGEEEDEDD